MKKFVLFLFLAALLLSSCHRATISEQCAEMVKHEKRRLPRNVAQGLVLDSMLYDARTNTLAYYHTIDDSLYSISALEASKNDMQQQLQTDISNSVALKRLKDEGVSFCYIYKSKWSGAQLMKLMFRNEDID